MTDKEVKSTEEKIIDAAEEVFHEKGYFGARMREIADRAGINKGLLHYYYKSKAKLFESIFSVAKNKMISRIQVILEGDAPIQSKIDALVDQYMDMVLKNPNLPRFVLNELNNNADDFVSKHFDEVVKLTFSNFQQAIQSEVDLGHLKPIDARQLLVNIISLVIFPVVAKPVLKSLVALSEEEYQAFMEERRQQVKAFVHDALRP
ncbi:MAG: TetR/AcrR family transcriptional regulator [Bacteroidetes bacterium]|nr:MAG: TetR/AcrR family transcriptional regulator [Bacteroidota bacterium]